MLAWNPLATTSSATCRRTPATTATCSAGCSASPPTDLHWSDEDALAFTRASVADLRAAYARYPGDPGIEALVTELLGLSPMFARMWAQPRRGRAARRGKRIEHPDVGPLEFECQVLHISDSDQRIIVYCAEPGSPTEAAFRRLAALPALTTLPAPRD